MFKLSIRKLKKCTFARRHGYKGTRILGYSVMLVLFGYRIF